MSNKSGSLDVRVVRWTINSGVTALTNRTDIVTGIPVSSGRHSGCRPRFGPDGRLWIGTGDAAVATNPQDPQSLGGKVLRVDTNGKGVAGNAPAPFDPRIYTYGHRNVQGLAFNAAARRFRSSTGPAGTTRSTGCTRGPITAGTRDPRPDRCSTTNPGR